MKILKKNISLPLRKRRIWKKTPPITPELKSFCHSKKWNLWATSLSLTQNYFSWKCWCSDSWVLQDEYPVTPGSHFPLESSQLLAPFLPERSPSWTSAMQWVHQTGDLAVRGTLRRGRMPGPQGRVGAWRTGTKSPQGRAGQKNSNKNYFPLKIAHSGKGMVIFTHLQGLRQSTVCFPASSPSSLLSLLNLAIIRILGAEKATGFPDGDHKLKSPCGCRSRRSAGVQGQNWVPQ